jgi:hypothetical protein
MKHQRLIFNLYQALGSLDEEEVTYIYANDPIILLDRGQLFARHTTQRAKFPTAKITLDDPVFGSSLDWAYCEYIVHRLWAPDERDDLRRVEAAPLGNAPPQSVRSRRRPLQLAHARLPEALDRAVSDADERLYLFNVIVAIEWLPTQQYMRQLEWGFRHASDLLYDVTNGRMAFGQVLFADSDWMGCADIQIMASNRLLPQSWVGGLIDKKKYTPIRVGRGVWNRKPEIAIPWDEPEAYRTLIHEWGHYALALRDEYLGVVSTDEALTYTHNRPERPVRPESYCVVVPRQGITSHSLMATPEGNSELSNPIGIPDELHRKHYPRLNMPAGEFAGPGRLPLPLPNFHRIGQLAEQGDNQITLSVPSDLQDERCWVYVLHGAAEQPERIVAQGTLDARSRTEGFELLGAEQGDTVVLIEDNQNQLKVRRGTIDRVDEARSAYIQKWEDATPESLFLIDVQPNKLQHDAQAAHAPNRSRAYKRRAEIRISVKKSARGQQDDLWISVAPFDTAANGERGRARVLTATVKPGDSIDVPALDGHVLVRLGDSLMITTYSQGGSPLTTPHVPTNPIAAGSSNGEALLFFDNPTPTEEDLAQNTRVRVITTTLHGLQDQLPDGARARSDAFSIASNEPFRAKIKPTLVILNDVNATYDDEELLIYRLTQYDEETGLEQWTSLPTYVQPGDTLTATPLAAPLDAENPDGEKAGGKLLLSDDQLGEETRIEYFRLFSKKPAQSL